LYTFKNKYLLYIILNMYNILIILMFLKIFHKNIHIKKGLFDIADDAYMKEFLEREFINDADTNHTEILIYKILFIIINIYEVISLI